MTWTVTFEGTVERVDALDIDKSGRNPKYNIDARVRIDEVVEPPDDASISLPAVVRVRLRSKLRENPAPHKPPVGARLRITARGSGNGQGLLLSDKVETLPLSW